MRKKVIGMGPGPPQNLTLAYFIITLAYFLTQNLTLAHFNSNLIYFIIQKNSHSSIFSFSSSTSNSSKLSIILSNSSIISFALISALLLNAAISFAFHFKILKFFSSKPYSSFPQKQIP